MKVHIGALTMVRACGSLRALLHGRAEAQVPAIVRAVLRDWPAFSTKRWAFLEDAVLIVRALCLDDREMHFGMSASTRPGWLARAAFCCSVVYSFFLCL